MATVIQGTLSIVLKFLETKSVDSGIAVLNHELDMSATRANGSSSSQVQKFWIDAGTVSSGTPVDIDLRGVLTSLLDGTAMDFATVVGFAVKHRTATTARNLTIGAGSNPFITWLAATGDGVLVGPSGLFMIESPVDGYATTAGTADILRLASSSSDIDYTIAIWGR